MPDARSPGPLAGREGHPAVQQPAPWCAAPATALTHRYTSCRFCGPAPGRVPGHRPATNPSEGLFEAADFSAPGRSP